MSKIIKISYEISYSPAKIDAVQKDWERVTFIISSAFHISMEM